ncbi:MAG: NHL repeat-containing protein [Fimbriimonadaceae bacterium]|nr:NHL repeat-containing protein [Fimbriimonadaceae bacterium]QYK55195.1 MAG: NHL repeat-containing protein [Fimbriimonadaceae bacterium]
MKCSQCLPVLFVLAAPALSLGDYYTCSNDVPNEIGAMYRTDEGDNLVETFGESVLSYPIYQTFDSKGELYVADYGNGKIQRFSADGTYLGVFAENLGQMGSIQFLPDGSLLSARYEGGPILHFAENGLRLPDFVSNTGLNRHGQMAVDSSGNVYVCSWVENTILWYDPAGNPLGVFSDLASSGIEGVVGMLFDANGDMYVSEYLTYKIKKLDANGSYLGDVFSTNGECEYLSYDSAGNLLVPQFFNNLVERYDPAGNLLGTALEAPGPYLTIAGPETFAPSSVSIRRGRLESGNVGSLVNVDGDALRVCKFIVPNQVIPPVEVEVSGLTTNLSPSHLNFYLSSRMVHSGAFRQEVVMVRADGTPSTTVRRADSLSGSTKTVALYADVPSNFVTVDGLVRARYLIRQTGPASVSAWCHEADQASWTIVP